MIQTKIRTVKAGLKKKKKTVQHTHTVVETNYELNGVTLISITTINT